MPSEPGFISRTATSLFSAAANFGVRHGLIKSDIIPAGLIRIDADYRQADGSYRSTATPQEVLLQYESSLWVYACVRALAQAVADAPRTLKRVIDNAPDEVVEESPVLDLLNAPAPGETWHTWIAAVVSYLELDGRYFAEKVRRQEGSESGKSGEIIGLNTLVNSKVRYDLHPKTGVKELIYTPNASGVTTNFEGKDVIVIRYFDPVRLTAGVAPLKPAWLASQTDQAQREWNAFFFRNGAEPDTLLQPTKEIAPQELIRLKNEFMARNTNRRNARGVYAPPFGLEIKPYGGASMRDLQFDKLGIRNREDICAAYRVPPVVLGIVDSSLLATSDVQRQLFRDLRIKPLCRFIFAALQQLIDEVSGEPGRYYLDLDEQAMMLASERAASETSLLAAVGAGVVSVAEARAKMGFKVQVAEEPGGRDTDSGDEYAQPNETVVEKPEKPAAATSGEPSGAQGKGEAAPKGETGAGEAAPPSSEAAGASAEKSAATPSRTPYRLIKARDAKTRTNEAKLRVAFSKRLAIQKSAVVRMLLSRAS